MMEEQNHKLRTDFCKIMKHGEISECVWLALFAMKRQQNEMPK